MALTKVDTVTTTTLTLAGANTYSGATTVSQGELRPVTGSISSPVTVASGATLSGTGSTGPVTAYGSVSAGVGGAGRPGHGQSALSSSAHAFAVNVANHSTTEIDVTGSINLGGANLSVNGSGTNPDGYVLVLIKNDYEDAVTGQFANLPEGSAKVVAGTTYYITYKYNAERAERGTGNDVALVPGAYHPPPDNFRRQLTVVSETDEQNWQRPVGNEQLDGAGQRNTRYRLFARRPIGLVGHIHGRLREQAQPGPHCLQPDGPLRHRPQHGTCNRLR